MGYSKLSHWRHDTRQNDTHHNDIQRQDTQHYGLIIDTQHIIRVNNTQYNNALRIMLSVVMLSVTFYLLFS